MLFDDLFERLNKMQREIASEYERVFDSIRKDLLDCDRCALSYHEHPKENDKKSVETCSDCCKPKDKDEDVSVSIKEQSLAHNGSDCTCNSDKKAFTKEVNFCNKADRLEEADRIRRECRVRRRLGKDVSIDDMLPDKKRRIDTTCSKESECPDEKTKSTCEKIDKIKRYVDAINSYSRLAEEIINDLPHGSNSSSNRRILRAYFILAVLLNKYEIRGFINLYQDVFDIFKRGEYGVPSIEDKILNDFRLHQSFINLVNELHQDDGKWAINFHSFDSYSDDAHSVSLHVSMELLNTRIVLYGKKDNFMFDIGRRGRSIPVTDESVGCTIKRILTQVLA